MTNGLIHSEILTIKDLFNDFYDIPAYQRDYVWLPEHIEQLLDDVQQSFEDKRVNYFLGTIVVSPATNNKNYELIDGQQRLTTLTLIFCAFKHYLQRHQIMPYPVINNILMGNISISEINMRLRMYPQYAESRRLIEYLAEDRGIEIDKILLNNMFDQQERSVFANLLRGYQTITKWLEEKYPKPDSFREFSEYFIVRVMFIRIRTINVNEAMRLFETINERGVRLDAVSLLKNMLFMNVDEIDYIALQDEWNKIVRVVQHGKVKESTIRFVRYMVMAEYLEANDPLIREDSLYHWFNANRKRTQHDKKPFQFVKLLKERADQFIALRRGNTTNGAPCDGVNNILILSSTIRQHIPCMLAAHKLTDAQQQKLAHVLENTLFTLIFTSFSPSVFEKKLTFLTSQLRMAQNDAHVDQIKKYLNENFIEARIPEFINRLRTFNVLRMRPNVLRYVLAKLTRKMMSDDKTPLDNYIDKLDFCPIIPLEAPHNYTDQQIQQHMYVAQSIGNYVLIEKKLAKDVRENTISFAQAMTMSNVPYIWRLNQKIAANGFMHEVPAKWDMHTVQARRDFMIALAEELWLA